MNGVKKNSKHQKQLLFNLLLRMNKKQNQKEWFPLNHSMKGDEAYACIKENKLERG